MNARDMHGRIIRFLLTALVLVLGLFPSGAAASTYDSILAFGDSLSAISGNDKRSDGRWIVGPVWVEYLSTRLGAGLTDKAVGGTSTSLLLSQVNSYGGTFDKTLVTVWAGGADLILSDTLYDISYETAAGNINEAILALIDNGAHNFVIPNMLNIALVPNVIDRYGDSETQMKQINDWCLGFNAELNTYLQSLKSSHRECNFYTYDTYTMLTNMVENPSKYGFSNAEAIFYDDFHPSSQTHAYLADQVYSQVVPLPASLLLFGSGLLGLIGIRRRIKG